MRIKYKRRLNGQEFIVSGQLELAATLITTNKITVTSSGKWPPLNYDRLSLFAMSDVDNNFMTRRGNETAR